MYIIYILINIVQNMEIPHYQDIKNEDSYLEILVDKIVKMIFQLIFQFCTHRKINYLFLKLLL